jgi:hypothetical protein
LKKAGAPEVSETLSARVSRKRPFWIILRPMIGLTDTQLGIVMSVARVLPVEKRDIFLQRIAAMLTMRGHGHFDDSDMTEIARLALTGLAHQPAA